MRRGPIGEELNQSRSEIGPGTIGRPLRHRVHGREVIAVDPQSRDAIGDGVRSKRRLLAAGNSLERRNRPLIVYDIEDDRRAVNAGKGERVMEVAFGGRAVTDPGGSDTGISLVGGGHSPADRLAVLSAEIARDGKETGFL